eukprot:5947631-Alexandrium_andersonii.AAC.1
MVRCWGLELLPKRCRSRRIAPLQTSKNHRCRLWLERNGPVTTMAAHLFRGRHWQRLGAAVSGVFGGLRVPVGRVLR